MWLAPPPPLPVLCSSVLVMLLLLASCSPSADGRAAPSASRGASPVAKRIRAATAAGGANGTGSSSPAVPAPPPAGRCLSGLSCCVFLQFLVSILGADVEQSVLLQCASRTVEVSDFQFGSKKKPLLYCSNANYATILIAIKTCSSV
jgi:hypothetical protein